MPAERVAEVVNVSADLGRHTERLRAYADLGFDQIYLHFVGKDQGPVIDAFGDKVLPQLTS